MILHLQNVEQHNFFSDAIFTLHRHLQNSTKTSVENTPSPNSKTPFHSRAAFKLIILGIFNENKKRFKTKIIQ